MKSPILCRPSAAKLTALGVAACLLAFTQASAFPILTNVVETGGDNEATDTIVAQWTGVTWNTTVANEPTLNTPVGTPFTVPFFGEDVPAYVDRAHEWNGASVDLPIPGYLLGGEYIMIGNDNRDNIPFQLDLYLKEPAVVFMLIDWRNGDTLQGGTTSNTDPPFLGAPLNEWAAMTWMSTEGFQPVATGYNRSGRTDWPDEVGYDEVGTRGIGPGADIQQYGGVYYKIVTPGAPGTPAISLYESAAAGQNMYGVVVTPVAPAVPAGLDAISLNARVALNWTPSSGASEYVIKRSSTQGGPYTAIATNTTASYTDTGLVNFQSYYYVVSARGLFGESSNSAEAVGTPKLAPENLVAQGGNNQVLLSWSALDGAASYTVRRADVSGGPYTELATGISQTSYVDADLPAGWRYYYTVSAPLTAGGESANADEAEAFTAPNVPANFLAEQFAATVIRLRWSTADQIPATTTTLVEKSTDGTSFAQVAAVVGGANRYFDVGLAPNLTNYYRIRATNSGGFTAYTEISSATTPASGINVNFADTAVTGVADYPIPGYLDDFGLVFGDRGNGYSYGWDDDNAQHDRLRNSVNSPDRRYDTFNHLQKTDPLPAARTWEVDLPNGLYLVHIVSGDATATDSVFHWDVEGYVSQALAPAANDWWREFHLTVRVNDGRLTLNNGPLAANNKIAFVDIYPAVPMPNEIATHPVSQTVTQNQSVTFSVEVSGGPEPYGFQWRLGGNPINGANEATYTIPLVQPSDAGVYSVVVTNAGGLAAVSSNATLTVITDTFAPVALSAGSVDGNVVGICFSEFMDPGTALAPGNYQINGVPGSVAFVEFAATDLAQDQRIVYLTLASPVTANFNVTISSLQDLAGNTMASTMLNGEFMGLTAQDIGVVGWPGSSRTCDGQTVEMVGSGADIWGTFDDCHFAYRPWTGDFDARVRLASLTRADNWTKAGIMAREDLADNARNVFLCATPLPLNNLYQTQWRDVATGDSASSSTIGGVSYPNAWLRLVRQGNTFTTLVMTNDVDWIVMHTYTPSASYPAQVYLGLGLTAHNNSLTATGQFSNFSVTVPAADVGLQMTAAADVVPLNGTITYTITAANPGFATATGVVVTDPLPVGVTYVDSSASAGSTSHAAGTVTWNVGDLAAGASATLTINATATTSGSKVNMATATSGSADGNPANNTATVTVEVTAAFSLTSPGFAGGKFSFSMSTALGVGYVVEYTDSLTIVDWKTLSTIPGTGGTVVVEDNSPPTERYYRVRLAAP
ncbi:MAG: DUF11 domain-containing protein [Verrucomicrobiae bacterium]|nr:DUF11 domain-containing protein [Verrucomicrobiae bacterium]